MRKALIILIFILIFVLLLLAVQFFFAYRDRKKNKEIPVKLSLLKALPIVLALCGFGMYAASWVEFPLAKTGLSFFELFSDDSVMMPSDFASKLLLYVLVISICLGLMISAAFFQLIFRISVKSMPSLIFEMLVGLTATITGFLICGHVKHILDRPKMSGNSFIELDTLFGEMFKISVGAGLIIITVIAILYLVFVPVQQYIHVRRVKSAGIMKENDFDKLRELKKLLEEGIISQEEFDSKKGQILSERI